MNDQRPEDVVRGYIEARGNQNCRESSGACAECDALDALAQLIQERDELRKALRVLSEWSLPRWEPDDPQTEGEQMRLYADAALAATDSITWNIAPVPDPAPPGEDER